jgi:hypothetical protein
VNSDDFLAILFVLVIVVFIFLFGFTAGERFGDSYKNGYTQALVDAKQGKPAKYVLKKQCNGETVWMENTEEQNK